MYIVTIKAKTPTAISSREADDIYEYLEQTFALEDIKLSQDLEVT